MKDKTYLLAGFSRVEAIPEEPQPLAGWGNTKMRMHKNVLDPTCVTSIALTDKNGETVLLLTVDIINYPKKRLDFVLERINKVTGVKRENIMITCTHTHSAPDPYSGGSCEAVEKFYVFLADKAAEASLNALGDRVPSYVLFGTGKTDKLNFVRHYEAEGGGVLTNNHDNRKIPGAKLIKHITEADNLIQVIKFVRSGIKESFNGTEPQDKKDIIYINWRAHGTKTGGMDKYDLSADIFYPIRKYVEDDTGALCGYYQGCAGNIEPRSMIKEENPSTDYMVYGRAVADCVLKALENLTPVNIDDFKLETKSIEFNVNHALEEKKELCLQLYKLWGEHNDREEIAKLGKPEGIFSPYHAGAIINRSKLGQTDIAEISVVTMGDLALCYLPGEPFDNFGKYIRENSPFKYTVVMGYSGPRIGYVPSKAAYKYGCYECDSTIVGEGTGEKLSNEILEILKKQRKNIK